MSMNIFIPLTKVDEEKRLVYGVATAEAPDRAGEICDYASTKPHYEKWSGDIQKASGGKSLGNLRAMHGKVAAGRIDAISFNDDAKQIEICAKVVDDNEWKKVIEGVYTGFSQGGSYEKRWKDGELYRYTAVPSEVSLVDLPCLPDATFSLIKADGAAEERHFKPTPAEPREPTNDEVAKRAVEMAKAAGNPDGWDAHLDAARAALTEEMAKAAAPAPAPASATDQQPQEAPTNADGVEQVWKAKDGKTFAKKADALAHNETLAKAADPVAAALERAKAAIEKAATGEGGEAPKEEPKTFDKAALETTLTKWLGEEVWDASRAIDALNTLFNLLRGELAEMEEKPEQTNALREAISRLKDFVISEIMEDNADQGRPLYMAAKAEMEKRGARNSAADMKKIQAMHDHSVGLGATCGGADKAAGSEDLEKITAQRDTLQKALDAHKAETAAAIDALTKSFEERFEALAKSPIPAPQLVSGTHVAEKGGAAADGGMTDEEVAKRWDEMPQDQRAMLLIKVSQSRPIPMTLRPE